MSHPAFNLRFSDLVEIENACREDEDDRAARTIDWIGARISRKSLRWVEIMDKSKSEGFTTPWWEELKKCSEGNHVPSPHEGWNHPVAGTLFRSNFTIIVLIRLLSVVFAVSTTAANPLQALEELHSRRNELPSWVDSTHLRCSLIIHPQNSSMSDPMFVVCTTSSPPTHDYCLQCRIAV